MYYLVRFVYFGLECVIKELLCVGQAEKTKINKIHVLYLPAIWACMKHQSTTAADTMPKGENVIEKKERRERDWVKERRELEESKEEEVFVCGGENQSEG